MSKIDAEDERCCPKGPKADLSLALDRSQPVVAAISYLDGVIVIESSLGQRKAATPPRS